VGKTSIKIDEDLGRYLIASISAASLNHGRVTHYEEIIKKGKRPAVIVFRCLDAYGESFNYVLDGHCKLLAYASLELMPHVIFISQESANYGGSPPKWDFTPFIYLLSPWQAKSFLEHFGDFKLADSKGNMEALSPFIFSSITEAIEICWAQDRTIRYEHYYKNGFHKAFLYQGYMNDRPSTSFRYQEKDRHIFYHLSGNQLVEVQEHAASNWEMLVHKKWNPEKGILEDIPIQKPEPIREFKASDKSNKVYKSLKPSWRERYKNEIYYVGMGLFMLLRLLNTCS